MIYGFVRVTRVALNYEFGGVSFLLIELDFFIIFFFSHIVKKRFQENVMLLNFISSWTYSHVWLVDMVRGFDKFNFFKLVFFHP
jgi:hypothetical protein